MLTLPLRGSRFPYGGAKARMLRFDCHRFSCDGASPNRKFYKMHGKSGELTYKTPNPFHEDLDIYFICDVPHLLKTTRNCWSNSLAIKYSRAFWVS